MSAPVRRTFDPVRINAAANHPQVRLWLGALALGELDFAPLVTDPANVVLANDYGGFICHRIGEGLYEVHSLFTPEGRGRLVAETARGLRYLFAETDCVRVVTKVPGCNPRAAALSRRAGFTECFTRPDAWDAPDGSRCAVSYQEVTLDAWTRSATHLPEAGQALADLVGLEGQDNTALRMLGALAELIRAGNAGKAAWLYGSQAFFAGLPPVSFLSARPIVIALNGAVVQSSSGVLEVIR